MTMHPNDDLARAETEAAVARHRLLSTMGALKERLTPGALVQEAKGKLKEAGKGVAQSAGTTVRRHPLPAIGVVAAIAAFIARKPLIRLIRRQ